MKRRKVEKLKARTTKRERKASTEDTKATRVDEAMLDLFVDSD